MSIGTPIEGFYRCPDSRRSHVIALHHGSYHKVIPAKSRCWTEVGSLCRGISPFSLVGVSLYLPRKSNEVDR